MDNIELLEEKVKNIQNLRVSNFIIKTSSTISLTCGASILAISIDQNYHPAIKIISSVLALVGTFGVAYSNIIDTDNNEDSDKLNKELEEKEKELVKSEDTFMKIKRMQKSINE